jgi:hypothetical protein
LTTHGLQAKLKTWASERTNLPCEIIEAALAHVEGDKVEAAYWRRRLVRKAAAVDDRVGEVHHQTPGRGQRRAAGRIELILATW